MMSASSTQPGLSPERIFEALDDDQATRILPGGAFKLIRELAPDRISGQRRAETLGNMLSLESAVDDPDRRSVLLDAVPNFKIAELEERTETDIVTLRRKLDLEKSVRRALLGFFGAPTFDEVPADSRGDAMAVEPARGLFPHQKRVASAVEKHLHSGEGRAMLHLPTGVGKTRVAMSIVASHLRTRPGLVLWLAATRELLEQAAEEFRAMWQVVGDRPIDCLCFWSHHDPPIEEAESGIVIAGLAKLHSYGRERKRLWNLGNRTSMMVFDEAHQAVAETYQDLVETIVTRNPRTPLLGLSATPGRTWDNPAIDAAVATLFQENKVTMDFLGKNPIRHLTDEGYLAEIDFSLLNVKPGLRLSPDDLAEVSASLDIPAGVAVRLGEDEQRNLRIVQRLLQLSDAHRRILVFAASVANATLLAGICKGIGLEADAVTGKTAPALREHVIQRFKRSSGPHRVLINYGVLTTGFDAPAVSAVLIARPTKSLVLYSQMVGRAIRGPLAGGTERCEIVTVIDTNLPGFGDVAEAFTNWEDVWSC